MKPYTLSELKSILNAQLMGNENVAIDKIWIDSRMIIKTGNGIFIALKGTQQDGHNYIADAYKKGIRCFLVNKPLPNLKDAHFLVVEDTQKALQEWAKIHREKFDIPVIAITGSNGKTIVKEWLHQLLYKSYKIVRSPKSYNSQIGVPLSLLEIESEDNLAIIEVGISQPNEMQILQKIVQPTIGVLTNIGRAHSAFFKNRAQHIQEKIKLFKGCEKLILNADDDEVLQAVQNHPDLKNIPIFTWGKSTKSNLKWLGSELKQNATQIDLEWKDESFFIEIPFTSEVSVLNAINVLAIGLDLDNSVESLISHFPFLLSVEMRLVTKEGQNDSVIINDAFNSDLSSLPFALNLLAQQPQKVKTLILTDVLQNRGNPDEIYQEAADIVNAYDLQKIILIGTEIIQHQEKFNQVVATFPKTESFLSRYQPEDFANEAVLLKGARMYGLEKISTWLEKQSHDTVLEVNLQALTHNLNYFRSKLKPNTKLMCMVKAFGYGSGGFEVAQLLENQKVDYLGVAYADEGNALRQAGISAPIMVMNPEQSSYETVVDAQLEPEIYSLRVLNLFTQTLINKSIPKAYPIHIKLNTGMNRLGFREKDLSELAQQLRDNPYVKVVSVFSHLAASESAKEKEFTQTQIHRYQSMYDYLSTRLEYQPIRHILNSEGILHYPDEQMDMVRLGIGMYGWAQDEQDQMHLQNVVAFKTVISQINHLKEGDTVSYGRHFTAQEKTRIATIPVGYADGIPRTLSNNKGKVYVNGKTASIVGSICMDMMMVDVTEIACDEGDEVVVFNSAKTLSEMATQAQTITYEILTSISHRVKRIYIRE